MIGLAILSQNVFLGTSIVARLIFTDSLGARATPVALVTHCWMRVLSQDI